MRPVIHKTVRMRDLPSYGIYESPDTLKRWWEQEPPRFPVPSKWGRFLEWTEQQILEHKAQREAAKVK